VTTVFAEFDDLSILAMMYERYDGTPVKYVGAVSYDDGRVSELAEFHHDHEFDHDTRQLLRSRLRFADADGEVWEIEAEPRMRLHLAGGGYTSGARRRGHLGAPFWSAVWDVDDPALLPEIDHLNDNISHLACGGRAGHGIVETLLGEHDRYRVAPHWD
jgi:hypothetical protein